MFESSLYPPLSRDIEVGELLAELKPVLFIYLVMFESRLYSSLSRDIELGEY